MKNLQTLVEDDKKKLGWSINQKPPNPWETGRGKLEELCLVEKRKKPPSRYLGRKSKDRWKDQGFVENCQTVKKNQIGGR